jgi:hypothetical protein
VPYSAVWVLILHFACRHFAGTFSKKICGPRHKNKLSTPDNLVVYLLQSDSLSALLISAYPAAMFLASALRLVAITPVKTLKMTRLAWTYREMNVLIAARCLHDVARMQAKKHDVAAFIECC